MRLHCNSKIISCYFVTSKLFNFSKVVAFCGESGKSFRLLSLKAKVVHSPRAIKPPPRLWLATKRESYPLEPDHGRFSSLRVPSMLPSNCGLKEVNARYAPYLTMPYTPSFGGYGLKIMPPARKAVQVPHDKKEGFIRRFFSELYYYHAFGRFLRSIFSFAATNDNQASARPQQPPLEEVIKRSLLLDESIIESCIVSYAVVVVVVRGSARGKAANRNQNRRRMMPEYRRKRGIKVKKQYNTRIMSRHAASFFMID